MESERVHPVGQDGTVHTAPHAPSGCHPAETHLHQEVVRVRRCYPPHGGEMWGGQGGVECRGAILIVEIIAGNEETPNRLLQDIGRRSR